MARDSQRIKSPSLIVGAVCVGLIWKGEDEWSHVTRSIYLQELEFQVLSRIVVKGDVVQLYTHSSCGHLDGAAGW